MILSPSNLLVDQGQLRAIIDWGGMGVGDPACDVWLGHGLAFRLIP